jgi:hypothetical protein
MDTTTYRVSRLISCLKHAVGLSVRHCVHLTEGKTVISKTDFKVLTILYALKKGKEPIAFKDFISQPEIISVIGHVPFSVRYLMELEAIVKCNLDTQEFEVDERAISKLLFAYKLQQEAMNVSISKSN